MLALRLAPVFLALAVLGAHFYRAGEGVAVAVVALLLALLFVPRRWAARALQVGLALGTLEWVRTTLDLVAMRQAQQLPWIRMAAILGTVAACTALCLLVFRSPRVRLRFGFGLPPGSVSPSSVTRLGA